MREGDHMPKRKSKDYVEVAKMCRAEGFSEGKVFELCKPLCEDFGDKNYEATKDAQVPQTEEEITQDKHNDRDIFFEVLTKPIDQTEKERDMLIDNIIKKPWFRGKVEMILDEVGNFRVLGPNYKEILSRCYFYFDGKKEKQIDIYTDMGISSSTFYDRLEIAIILLGILMWKYVKRRQYEDMAKGIIPYKEIPKNEEDLNDLTPLDEL